MALRKGEKREKGTDLFSVPENRSVPFSLFSQQGFLELVERTHRRQHLLDAAVRIAFLTNGREELAILQLDAIHRHINLRDVDGIVLAVNQFVVARDVSAVVADVAEERAQRPVIVERQRESA